MKRLALVGSTCMLRKVGEFSVWITFLDLAFLKAEQRPKSHGQCLVARTPKNLLEKKKKKNLSGHQPGFLWLNHFVSSLGSWPLWSSGHCHNTPNSKAFWRALAASICELWDPLLQFMRTSPQENVKFLLFSMENLSWCIIPAVVSRKSFTRRNAKQKSSFKECLIASTSSSLPGQWVRAGNMRWALWSVLVNPVAVNA